MPFSFESVSRETLDKLKIYEELLQKWQCHINLISNTTLDHIWQRHFLDSAQLIDYIDDKNAPVVDVGSGAGFPGAVLSILGCRKVTLVDRDNRKANFLRTVARATGASFKVFDGDMKDFEEQAAYLVSRAVAPVFDLLHLSQQCITANTNCLFLKGENVDEELTGLKIKRDMTVRKIPSITCKGGWIIEIKNIKE